MYRITLKPQSKTDGTHTVTLRVVSKGSRNTKRIDRRVTLSELPSVHLNQWNNDACRYRKNFKGYKAANNKVKMIEDRCDDIVEELQRERKLTVQHFIDRFLQRSKSITKVTVADAILYKIGQFERDKSWGTYEVYAQTLRRWNAYLRHGGKRHIYLQHLSLSDLNSFKDFLLSGKGNGGVKHRMRDLRASFNEAIKVELIPKKESPFDKFDWKSLRSDREHARKPLTLDQYKAFKQYTPKNPGQAFWQDIFIFMVYCYGINLKDLICLKHSNIKDALTKEGPIKVIRYVRKKTERKRPDAYIDIIVTEPIQELIDKYKDDSSPYLFPILKDYSFAQDTKEWEEESKRASLRGNYNIRNISKALGFKEAVSAYTSRHTFASIQFWEDVPVNVISQALGHSDVKTTATYLSNLDLITMKEKLNTKAL